jgi:outer membrane protein assembly complex protein YaeT
MNAGRSAWALVCALFLWACAAAPQRGGVRVETSFAGEFDAPERELLLAIAPDLENVERRSSPRSAVDDAAYALVEYFRERGYARAAVEYEVLEQTAKLLRARFVIRAGPRARVERIEFDGAERFQRKELLAAIGLRDPSTRGADPLWYSERAFERAVGALEAFCAERGHARARIEAPRIEIDAAGERVVVTLTVDEGPRYVLSEAPRIAGGVPALDATLEWEGVVGRPFTPRTLGTVRGRVGELYERSGYPDVRVEGVEVVLDESGSAQLEVQLATGTEVSVSAVRLVGLARTRSSFARELIDVRPGATYDVRALRESFRKLFATGLFTRVQTSLEPEGAAERELVFEFEEAASREIYIEPGLGSYEGPRLLAGWRDINLFGSGRVLRLEGLAANRAQRAVASVTEPRVFGSEVQGSLSVFREVRDEPSFDKDERGAALSFLRNLTREARAEFEYRYRRSELTQFDITDPLAQDELDDFDISSIQSALSFDNRDSIFTPTRGVQSRLSVELAAAGLGSELDFLRVQFAQSVFAPLSDNAVLGFTYRGGLIAPLGSTQSIPVQERYFNGGENSVRSFREDKLGPRDSGGEPLGGEAFNLLSAELRHALRGALWGALFYDTGNVEPQASRFVEFNGFRHGVGLGLRYALPIGPLRLDVSANPDPRRGEPDWVTHFSLGMSF